jgi:hypothetical protein
MITDRMHKPLLIQHRNLRIGVVAPALPKFKLRLKLSGEFRVVELVQDVDAVFVFADEWVVGGFSGVELFEFEELDEDGEVGVLGGLAAVGVDLEPPGEVFAGERLSVEDLFLLAEGCVVFYEVFLGGVLWCQLIWQGESWDLRDGL